MKLSNSFFYTKKEDVKGEDSKSGNLLVRAGYIKKEASGVYMFMPLGLRVKQYIEKIVRIIAINDKKKYKDNKLKLGIITVDLSDIKNINGEQLYKGFFEKFKEMCDNELCDI